MEPAICLVTYRQNSSKMVWDTVSRQKDQKMKMLKFVRDLSVKKRCCADRVNLLSGHLVLKSRGFLRGNCFSLVHREQILMY